MQPYQERLQYLDVWCLLPRVCFERLVGSTGPAASDETECQGRRHERPSGGFGRNKDTNYVVAAEREVVSFSGSVPLACFRRRRPAGRAGRTLHHLGEVRRGECVACDKSKSCSCLSDNQSTTGVVAWRQSPEEDAASIRRYSSLERRPKKSGTHTPRTVRRAASCHASSGHRRDQGSHDARGDATADLGMCSHLCLRSLDSLVFFARREGSSSGAYHVTCDYGRGGARIPVGRGWAGYLHHSIAFQCSGVTLCAVAGNMGLTSPLVNSLSRLTCQ